MSIAGGCWCCAFPVVVLGVVLSHKGKRKPPELGGFLFTYSF
jgi:hypothetical protein